MDDLSKLSTPYWELTAQELFDALGSSQNGISSGEAKARLRSFGPNLLEIRRDETALRLLIKQFTSPLVLILIFAVAVSVFVGEWTDAAVIFAIVMVSGIISFVQEFSAGNAVAKLRARLRHRVNAIRDGVKKQIDAERVVPGDIVLLSAGSLIPADGVVIDANDCFVNQAVLTGETFPVEKLTVPASRDAALAERTNCVFMGTSVRSGFAKVMITQTAASTEYGKIAGQLALRPPETEFQRGIRKFGLMLSRIMIVLVLVVFAVNVVMERPAVEALLFAIALAVGISPELLPAIITINLSKGAREMARSGVIVRRLEAIENLGSMDILCTDKTGTLTEGVVRLDGALDASGDRSDDVYRLAYLNAHFQSGIPNPLDEAIIAGPSIDLDGVSKAGEIPYDFSRKRLSVLISDAEGKLNLITKGALDNVLDVCSQTKSRHGIRPLTAEVRNEFTERFEAWSENGFRVLGVAQKGLGAANEVTRHSENDMTFEGFLLFLDPPKKDAGKAIKALADLRVGLKIITGDNRYVARHVADAVGMSVEGMLTGAELADLGDEALMHRATHTTLFVEVDPNQKERIIRALQKMGHVVGYMGDGINDAPALHDADVGISVDGAVDVAREAADFVLLKSGLDILERGIMEGRVTFANSLKYIFTTTSANFGNMFSMAGASLFLPFLPLLAKQILLNNFLSDIPAIAIASDNVDPEYIATPHRWDVKFIRNFMIVFGFVSSVFDFITFGLLLILVRAAEAEFQTGWFIESLLTELVVALIVRTRRSFYKSTPGRWLSITTLAVSILTIAIPYLPFSNVMGFVPLPAWVTCLIVLVTLAYVIVTEGVKKAFYKRIGTA